MGPYNKPKNKDTSIPGVSTGSPSTEELANQVGETRGAISSDIRELSDKFGSTQLKEEAKNAGKEFAAGAQEVVIDKAIEVKDAVVDTAVEVKDAIVEKAAVVTDAASEKFDQAKHAIAETLDDAGETAARWGGATLKFARANAVPLVLVGLGATWILGNTTRGPRARPLRYEEPERQGARTRRVVDRSWDVDVDPPVQDYDAARGKPAAAARARRPDGAVRREGGELMQRGKQLARREASAMRDRLKRAKNASLDFGDANPLTMAMGLLALGIGVGALLPTTAPEEKLLRPAREKFDRLMGDAREVASDAVETAKATVNESMARA